MDTVRTVKTYRTLFISDIHLGTKACQAEILLDFLKHSDAETYYLVGDVVDFWRVSRGAHWPQAQNDVIQKLLRKVRKGAKVVYVPGNHDDALRGYCGANFGGIELARKAVHETVDGRRFLIIHGDEFDVVVRYARWLAFLGDSAYVLALGINTHFNWVRRRLGMPYWSLSAYLKYKVKRAVNYIGEFETALAQEARRNGANGVICGHVHHASMREIDGIQYVNTGDWVESCTAVGETRDGHLELIRWADMASVHTVAHGAAKEIGAAA